MTTVSDVLAPIRAAIAERDEQIEELKRENRALKAAHVPKLLDADDLQKHFGISRAAAYQALNVGGMKINNRLRIFLDDVRPTLEELHLQARMSESDKRRARSAERRRARVISSSS